MNVGGGPPNKGGSGWGDPAALAAARELANSFKQGGKGKETLNRKGQGLKGGSDFSINGHGGPKRHQDRNFHQAETPVAKRETQQDKFDQAWKGNAPRPSARNYQGLQNFAPKAQGLTGTMTKSSMSRDALAFLQGQARKPASPAPGTQDRTSSQSARSSTTTAQAGTTATSSVQKHEQTDSQDATARLFKAPEKSSHGSGMSFRHNHAVDRQPQNANPHATPASVPAVCDNSATTPTFLSQTPNTIQADTSTVKPHIGGQPAAAADGLVSANYAKQLQPSTPARETQVKLSSADVLAQLQRKFCPKATEQKKGVIVPPMPTDLGSSFSPHAKANQDLKSSTGSTTSFVTAFRDLKLEDNEGAKPNKRESTPKPSQGNVSVFQGAKDWLVSAETKPRGSDSAQTAPREDLKTQVTPAHDGSSTQGAMVVPQRMKASINDWITPKKVKSNVEVPGAATALEAPSDHKSLAPAADSAPAANSTSTAAETQDTQSNAQQEATAAITLGTPKTTLSSSATAAPKRKKAPGLESSMFNRPDSWTDHGGKPSPGLSAQADVFAPSIETLQSQRLIQTPLGMTNNHITSSNQHTQIQNSQNTSNTSFTTLAGNAISFGSGTWVQATINGDDKTPSAHGESMASPPIANEAEPARNTVASTDRKGLSSSMWAWSNK